MGMFSWVCLGCGFSLRDCGSCSEDNWMEQGVCLTPRGTRVIGSYDCYGNLGGYNLADQIDGDFSIYHQACWELVGKPEYTKASCGARDQGFCLPTHGAPIPKPTLEWLALAKGWHAFEKVIDAFCDFKYSLELKDVEEKAAKLTDQDRVALLDAYRAEKARRHEDEQNQREAWFRNPDEEALCPPAIEWPNELEFKGLMFNWGWLGVLVSQDDYAQHEKKRSLKGN